VSRETWAAFKPPSWVDPDAFLFCGADPSWTPEKEGIACAPPPPGECPHCRSRGCYAHDADGNLLRDEWGEPVFLRGAIEDGSHAVCPKCRRYGLDRLLDRTPLGVMMRERPQADDGDGAGDDDDDGKRVDAITGRLDLSDLARAVVPVVEPGTVVKAVAAGTITVPERYAYLLDDR
jgi:hypothetical protein